MSLSGPIELTGVGHRGVRLAHVDPVGVGGVDQVGTVVEDEQRVVGVAGGPEAARRSEDLLVGAVLDAELDDVHATAQRGRQEVVGAVVADEVQMGCLQPLASCVHAWSLAGLGR